MRASDSVRPWSPDSSTQITIKCATEGSSIGKFQQRNLLLLLRTKAVRKSKTLKLISKPPERSPTNKFCSSKVLEEKLKHGLVSRRTLNGAFSPVNSMSFRVVRSLPCFQYPKPTTGKTMFTFL